jgi:hypothetical protein
LPQGGEPRRVGAGGAEATAFRGGCQTGPSACGGGRAASAAAPGGRRGRPPDPRGRALFSWKFRACKPRKAARPLRRSGSESRSFTKSRKIFTGKPPRRALRAWGPMNLSRQGQPSLHAGRLRQEPRRGFTRAFASPPAAQAGRRGRRGPRAPLPSGAFHVEARVVREPAAGGGSGRPFHDGLGESGRLSSFCSKLIFCLSKFSQCE